MLKGLWPAVLSGWKPVTTSGADAGTMQFIIFINDLDEGSESNFIKFADDTNMTGVVHTPDGCAAI